MKLLLTSAYVLGLVLQVTSLPAQQKTITPKKETRSSVNLRSVTTDNAGETMIDYQENGHRHKIKMKGAKILELNIDGKKIPEEEFPKYEADVKKIMIQVEKDREQADNDRVQAEKDRQQADRDREQADLDRRQSNKDREQADRDREQADRDREQAEADREHKEANREKVEQEKRNIQTEREQVERDRLQATKDRDQAAIDRKQAEKDREQAGRDREQAVRDLKQAELDRKQADEDRKLLDDMLSEVVRDKIVDSKESIKSLILDDTELTVNGIKQKDSLHIIFKSKYLKKSGSRTTYKNSGPTKGFSID